MRGAIRGAGFDAMVERGAPAGEGVAVRRMREKAMDSWWWWILVSKKLQHCTSFAGQVP